MAGINAGAEIDRPLLRYAGHSFRISKVVLWDTKAVYSEDGCDRLYLHHRIGVQAVWNPFATRADDGVDPWVSIETVREKILAPRQHLIITAGNATILESPLPGPGGQTFATDAWNGPKPVALNVLKILGARSVVCYFEIETWVPSECLDNQLSVLSHRWEASEELDSSYYVTRHVAGRAVFRTDLLLQRAILPDDFRARLFHPTLKGFKRENIRVTGSSDGTTVTYSFDDVQQPAGLLGGAEGRITRIKGTWGMGFNAPDVVANFFGIAYRYISMNVQVWGRRYTNRIDLISACLNAVAAFGFLNLQKLPTFYKADLIVDLIDKTAQLNATLVLDGAVANLSDVLLRHRPFELVADGDFPAAIDGLTTTAPVQQPEPTYASGTRGVLTHLVHQALLNPCGTPTKPVDRVLINKGVGRTF